MSQTTISFDQCVQTPEDVLFRELDGEAVLLNLDDESYYGLDEVGTRMWIVLEASKTISEAYNKLLSEFEVDAERLKVDMIELIQELNDHGLILIEDI